MTNLVCALFCLGLPAEAVPSGQPWDYFANSWAIVGLKDYPRGTRITPSHELILGREAHLMLKVGADLRPLGRKLRKTLLEGYLPVVLVEDSDMGVSYHIRIWATPLPTVKDWEAAFSDPGGEENYLNWVSVEALNTSGGRARAAFAAELTMPTSAAFPVGSASWDLAPGQAAATVVRVPFDPIPENPAFTDADPRLWLSRTISFWKGLLGSGAVIEVPDRKAMDCLRASHIYQLIGSDRGELHAGEGFYDEFYIRDGAYQVMQLEEAGFLEQAARAMEPFLRFQRPDGRFESQQGQLDANGQALWALWQYFLITADLTWLERAFPSMQRAAAWIGAARRQAPVGTEFAGLLPAALADGEFLWEGKNHIVGYDLWNLRGLICTAEAARKLGKEAEAEALRAEAKDYRTAIDAAWRRTGIPHMPPSWEKDGTHWGNTETLWPTPILEPADPRVRATMKEVRERFGGGFLEGAIRWCPGRVQAIHPYMSSYTTLASIALGESEKAVEEFYWYMVHSTATHGFPEGIYHRRRVAWGDTVPHLLGAAQYANLLRHMLIHEDGKDLHLLPAVPDAWLEMGDSIRIERAPTHFGPLDLSVSGTSGRVSIDIRIPRRDPPNRVVLHLPRSLRLGQVSPGVEVTVRPAHGEAWSFERVRMLCDATPRTKPIPFLVTLPRPATDPATFHVIDVSGAANTDPHKAPFGVENPGPYVFTGLGAGRQVAGGVPFEVLDSSQNSGKSLIVLEGENAAAAFPREAVIPVSRTGKRLYFLGNVHGWRPEDEGTGEWEAIAEYVIEYADGTRQIVPLIAGRTTDDWAMPPSAEECCVGLQGSPWHLNVLGVELRSVEVRRIVFRDLGTASSPVLAAVTMENPGGAP